MSRRSRHVGLPEGLLLSGLVFCGRAALAARAPRRGCARADGCVRGLCWLLCRGGTRWRACARRARERGTLDDVRGATDARAWRGARALRKGVGVACVVRARERRCVRAMCVCVCVRCGRCLKQGGGRRPSPPLATSPRSRDAKHHYPAPSDPITSTPRIKHHPPIHPSLQYRIDTPRNPTQSAIALTTTSSISDAETTPRHAPAAPI